MSLAAKVEEQVSTSTSPAEVVAVDGVTGTADPTSESIAVPEPAQIVNDAANPAQEVASETAKSEEKSEESPKGGLLKGFQQRLAGVFPKKSEKVSDPKEDKKDEKKQETTENKDEPEKEKEKETKVRSVSRKRNSVLGGFGLGKKEEKNLTEEATPADPASDATTEPAKPVEHVDNSKDSDNGAATETSTERPGISKRTSIFDSFKNHFVKKEKPEAAPVKEADAVSESAPVIPAVGISEPVPTEAFPAVTETTPEVTPEAKPEKTKVEKRKSSLPFGLGLKKEKLHVNEEDVIAEKPLSPFAKLRATVKSKASPKFSEKKEELPTSAEAKVEEEQTNPPTTSTTEPAVTPTPVSASA